jgi:hypothetical protein
MSGAVRGRRAILLLSALLVVMGLALVERIRHEVLQEADSHASTRLLHDFHAHYLGNRGVDLADYQAEPASFAEQHKGMRDVERYAKSFEEKDGGDAR